MKDSTAKTSDTCYLGPGLENDLGLCQSSLPPQHCLPEQCLLSGKWFPAWTPSSLCSQERSRLNCTVWTALGSNSHSDPMVLRGPSVLWEGLGVGICGGGPAWSSRTAEEQELELQGPRHDSRSSWTSPPPLNSSVHPMGNTKAG